MLCSQGNKVTIVEMADTVAPGVWCQHLDDILPKLDKEGVEILTSHKLVKITENSVELEEVKSGNKVVVEVDTVVLSIGVRPVNNLYKELKEVQNNVYVVGDALKTGRIANATKTAYDTAIKLV